MARLAGLRRLTLPYLIDGSNLGGALAGSRGARDRELVVEWVLAWSRAGRRAVVVFDGPEDPALARGYGRVALRFSGGRSADAVIRSLVERDPSRWIVVTDDRALRRAGREAGARVLRARELVRSASSDPPEPAASGQEKPAGPVDVDDWLEFFSSEEEPDGAE